MDEEQARLQRIIEWLTGLSEYERNADAQWLVEQLRVQLKPTGESLGR